MTISRRCDVALFLPALLLLPSLSHGAGPSGDALILLRTSTMTELWDFVEEWEDAGARLPHVYPPDLLIGDVPVRLLSSAIFLPPSITFPFFKKAAVSGRGGC